LERGLIKVNEAQETAEPGVFAIGDIVAGLPQLAHVGAMSGMVAAAKIAGRAFRPVRRDRIPGCTYTEPQIGSVGLTEAQAKEKGYEVKVGKFPFAGNSKATILGSHDGFVKIVADAKYGEILGVHILGPQATELIAEAVAVLELEGTVEEMMFTIHAHPTLAESLPAGRLRRRRRAWRSTRKRGPQKAPTKTLVSLRLSPEVINHFKATGRGWQTRIDSTLLESIKRSA
jgi:dihydrolipoamide dehydrogenase